MMTSIDMEFVELPTNMPLPFLKELIDLNIEKMQPILFSLDRQIKNSKQQQDVYYRAMKSMATRDPGFCFKMGELKRSLDQEIKNNTEIKSKCEQYFKVMCDAKEQLMKG